MFPEYHIFGKFIGKLSKFEEQVTASKDVRKIERKADSIVIAFTNGEGVEAYKVGGKFYRVILIRNN